MVSEKRSERCAEKLEHFAVEVKLRCLYFHRVKLSTYSSMEDISDPAVEIDQHKQSSVLEQPCCSLIFNNVLLWVARTERKIENCVSLIKMI